VKSNLTPLKRNKLIASKKSISMLQIYLVFGCFPSFSINIVVNFELIILNGIIIL
jgi:hypothetical protein